MISNFHVIGLGRENDSIYVFFENILLESTPVLIFHAHLSIFTLVAQKLFYVGPHSQISWRSFFKLVHLTKIISIFFPGGLDYHNKLLVVVSLVCLVFALFNLGVI